ncbi:MAG TPA: hypothetical protein VF483_07810 [Gemmatimonadaceae bacterium]
MRKLFGLLLILHGLAHACAGMNATGNPWLVTTLWLIATAAFVGSGLWILGAQFNWPRVDRATFLGAVASIWLLSYFPFALLIPGILLNFAIVAVLQVRVAATAPLPTRHPRLRRAGTWIAGTAFVYALGCIAAHPWFHRMGTTAEDRGARLLGDSLHANTGDWVITNNAITIHAPADSVWPWVAQIGQDRAGFYSYSPLENAVGARIRNADSIVPQWQGRHVGDTLPALPRDYMGGRFGLVGWRIDAIEPGRAMMLRWWGTFAVRPIDATTSKFQVRQWMPRRRTLVGFVMAAPEVLVFQPMHFIMQRGMLRGVKARAERSTTG